MRSSVTLFVSPNYDIDERIYFSDISISQLPLMNNYQNLIKSGKYDDALELIKDIDYYGADILNLFENRDHAIFEYLDAFVKPNFGSYTREEPTGSGNTDVYYIGSDGTQQSSLVWID